MVWGQVLINTHRELQQLHNDPVGFIKDLKRYGDPYGVQRLIVRLHCFSESYHFPADDDALNSLNNILEHSAPMPTQSLSSALFQMTRSRFALSNMDQFDLTYMKAIGSVRCTKSQLDSWIALLGHYANAVDALNKKNQEDLNANDFIFPDQLGKALKLASEISIFLSTITIIINDLRIKSEIFSNLLQRQVSKAWYSALLIAASNKVARLNPQWASFFSDFDQCTRSFLHDSQHLEPSGVSNDMHALLSKLIDKPLMLPSQRFCDLANIIGLQHHSKSIQSQNILILQEGFSEQVQTLESRSLHIDTLYEKSKSSPDARNANASFIDIPWLVDRSRFSISSLSNKRFYALRLLFLFSSLFVCLLCLALVYKFTPVFTFGLSTYVLSFVFPVILFFSLGVITCVHLKMLHVFAQQSVLDHIITSNSRSNRSFSHGCSEVVRSSLKTVILCFSLFFRMLLSNFNYFRSSICSFDTSESVASDTVIGPQEKHINSEHRFDDSFSDSESYAKSDHTFVSG